MMIKLIMMILGLALLCVVSFGFRAWGSDENIGYVLMSVSVLSSTLMVFCFCLLVERIVLAILDFGC